MVMKHTITSFNGQLTELSYIMYVTAQEHSNDILLKFLILFLKFIHNYMTQPSLSVICHSTNTYIALCSINGWATGGVSLIMICMC